VSEAISFTSSARKLGLISAVGTVLLIAAYLAALVAGVLSLSSSDQPIGDPWFSLLEILIILLIPFMVALTVAVHAWAPTETKVFSQLALLFMAMLALLTCSVHFVILSVGHQPAFSAPD
jgi:cytochrome bd-type quinol oxidase subunit 2